MQYYSVGLHSTVCECELRSLTAIEELRVLYLRAQLSTPVRMRIGFACASVSYQCRQTYLPTYLPPYILGECITFLASGS